jgi:hypothetical protein
VYLLLAEKTRFVVEVLITEPKANLLLLRAIDPSIVDIELVNFGILAAPYALLIILQLLLSQTFVALQLLSWLL